MTPDEQATVRAALVAARAGHWAGGQQCTLNSLFARWRGLVDELESEEGYTWCAPELSNDVWCRDALFRVWPLLPERVQNSWHVELGALDGRFRAATIQWPGHSGDEARWWHKRIPRLLAAEPGERLVRGWPLGWDMIMFPRPESIDVVS